jgi:hypothetical protein
MYLACSVYNFVLKDDNRAWFLVISHAVNVNIGWILNYECGKKISTEALLWQEFWFGSLKNGRMKSWL